MGSKEICPFMAKSSQLCYIISAAISTIYLDILKIYNYLRVSYTEGINKNNHLTNSFSSYVTKDPTHLYRK